MSTRFFGHRGARALAPENTLVSLERAVADRADGLEFDLRATSDGAIVLLHDATLDRTSTGRGLLAARTLAEVRALDAGAWFDVQFRGERIPTLDEVLDAFLGRVGLDLEMKEPLPEPALRALADRLAAGSSNEVFVSSFREEVLLQLRELVPHLPRGLLLEKDVPPPDRAHVRALGLSSILAHEASIDESFAGACRTLGLPLHTYTVNAPERALQLAQLGVEIVISDDPGRLRDGCGGSSAGTESSRGGG